MKYIQGNTEREREGGREGGRRGGGRNSFQSLANQVLANENQVLSRAVSRQTSKSELHSKQERFFYFISG